MLKLVKAIKSNKTKTFFLLILLLSLTRIDFRFDEINPGSFVDDAEYYYHVQTIAIDKDLDYSNQMPNTPYRNLNVDDPVKYCQFIQLVLEFCFTNNLFYELN